MDQIKIHTSNLSLKDVLLVLANVIFLCLYLTLAINNRISHDDFYSIYVVREFGVLDGVSLIYNKWCTRYVALLISFFITYFLKFKATLFIYQISLLVLSSSSVYYMLNGLKDSICITTRFQKINCSILISMAILYCSFDVGETWFWLSSSCTYLFSCIAFFFSLGIILAQGNRISYLLLALCGIIIGGSNGTLSLFILVLLTFFLIGIRVKKLGLFSVDLSSEKITKCITLFVSIHIAFIVMYIGKGNEIRESFFEEISIYAALLLNIKYTGIIVLKIIPEILPYCIIFSLAISTCFTPTIPIRSLKSGVKNIFICFVLFGVLIFLFQLPISYKTQDLGADRTLYPIAIATLMVLTYFFSQIILILSVNSKHIQTLTIFCLGTIVAINSFQFYQQFTLSERYSKSFDQRLNQISIQKNEKEIVLDRLPESGFLHSAEISPLPNHFTHDQLKLGLNVSAELKLKDR